MIFSCVLFENPIYKLTKNLFFLILSEELQEEFLELKIESVAKGNPTGITQKISELEYFLTYPQISKQVSPVVFLFYQHVVKKLFPLLHLAPASG